MSTSSTPRRVRLRRTTVGVAAVAVPLAFMAVTGAPAQAFAPNGGAEVFHEVDNLTGVTSNAIVDGYWGHEGAAKNGGTVYSIGADNGTGSVDDTTTAAALAKIGPDATINNLRVAYVLTSGNGSAEQPTVTDGEKVGQAFTWFTDSGIGSVINGNNQVTDYGTILSTQAQYDGWVAAGKHPQTFNANLVALDGDLGTVSAHPLGSSIFNTWADGTHISEVYYVAGDPTADGENTVKQGPDGKAEVAWQELVVHKLPADHSKDPTSGLPDNYDTVRTSALYTDLTAGVQTVGTTTTLGATPASPQNTGTNVTFTAHVAASSGSATPTGMVTFKDGANVLGTGSINGSGDASFSTSALSVGDHSIVASYGGDTGFSASDSSASSYHINGVATPTSTAISVDPGTMAAFAPVILTATVTPDNAQGSVNFHEGGHNLGSAPVNASGVATLTTSELGAGSHQVQADFIPSDSSAFGGSSDTSQSFTLTAATNQVVDEQTIKANIAPGTLLLSTPYTPDNPLDVGTLVLNGSASQYSGSAQFQNIDVTDTRAGDLPWTLTALAGDLSDGTTNTINGQNVGLTAMAQDSGPSPAGVTFTDQAASDPAALAGAPGTAGLGGTPKTVAHANLGLGAWVMHGLLTVNAPANTPAGVYTGTVTFTVS